MPKQETALYAKLNIVAQPHPRGIYRQIFERSVGTAARYWGNLFATITPLSETRDEVFTARLAVWMTVDEESDVISLDNYEEIPFSNSDVSIPPDIGLDSRIFEIAFNERTHILYVRLNNSDGKRISARRAETAVYNILSAASSDLVEELRVQVIPDQDSIERILNLPIITNVEIHLHRPNPDELDDDANNILDEELEGQNVKTVIKTLQKAPGFDTIVLSARNKIMAGLAAANGFVKGKGKNIEGRRVEASTRDHPEIIRQSKSAEDSDVSSIRQVARDDPAE